MAKIIILISILGVMGFVGNFDAAEESLKKAGAPCGRQP